ncbi:MAG: STAS domain-containing protein [Solirubrobacterales bacterium]
MAAEPHEREQDFELSIDRPDGGGTAIVLNGELDLASAPQLDNALSAAIDAGGEIVVDFQRCTFIDSTGISTIVRAGRRLVEQGGRRLAVTRLHSQPQKVFRIAGLLSSGLIALDE